MARGPYFKGRMRQLLPLIRRFVQARPTYGYCRITALASRELARKGLPAVNRSGCTESCSRRRCLSNGTQADAKGVFTTEEM
jgi:hypothetical protein